MKTHRETATDLTGYPLKGSVLVAQNPTQSTKRGRHRKEPLHLNYDEFKLAKKKGIFDQSLRGKKAYAVYLEERTRKGDKGIYKDEYEFMQKLDYVPKDMSYEAFVNPHGKEAFEYRKSKNLESGSFEEWKFADELSALVKKMHRFRKRYSRNIEEVQIAETPELERDKEIVVKIYIDKLR